MSPRRLNVPASVVDGGVVVVSGNPETFLLTLSLVVFRPMSGLSIDLGCHRSHSKIHVLLLLIVVFASRCGCLAIQRPRGSRGLVWNQTGIPILGSEFWRDASTPPQRRSSAVRGFYKFTTRKSQGLAFGRAILKQQDVLARSAASCSGARASLQPGNLIFTAGRSAQWPYTTEKLSVASYCSYTLTKQEKYKINFHPMLEVLSFLSFNSSMMFRGFSFSSIHFCTFSCTVSF